MLDRSLGLPAHKDTHGFQMTTVKTHTIGLKENDPYFVAMKKVRKAHGCSWPDASYIVYRNLVADTDEATKLRSQLAAMETALNRASDDLTSLRARTASAEQRLATIKAEVRPLRALKERADSIVSLAKILSGSDD